MSTLTARVGDTVHVRGVVVATNGEFPIVRIEPFGVHASVRPGEIVHVEPRALAVGDGVKFTLSCDSQGQCRTIPATIIALHKGNAWLDVDGQFDQVQPVALLVRA